MYKIRSNFTKTTLACFQDVIKENHVIKVKPRMKIKALASIFMFRYIVVVGGGASQP